MRQPIGSKAAERSLLQQPKPNVVTRHRGALVSTVVNSAADVGTMAGLLAGHRDAHRFLRRDQVIGTFRGACDGKLYTFDAAIEVISA